ncbi:hypothetical protein RvY_06220 [Ramazzottius varieornatus]|uniref:Uncharacterized protein n=1 Tax=Ramazzottius varieornatus TaxID=947166 RepID=A0A1D1UXU1_RAMVA|nr:hypothetical protein RvY_06220 [Ramazzottius varieornatus]
MKAAVDYQAAFRANTDHEYALPGRTNGHQPTRFATHGGVCGTEGQMKN